MFGLVFSVDESGWRSSAQARNQRRMRARDHPQLDGSRGLPCIARGGGLGIVAGGRFFLPAWYLYGFLFQLFFLYFPFYISISVLLFQGLGMLKRAICLKEEACQLEEEAQCLGDGRIRKSQCSSGRFGGGRFLWASEGSYSTPLHILSPTLKKACHILSATVSHLPPQEPTGVTPEISDPAARIAEQALEAASSASEEALPTDMQPLCIQLRGIKCVQMLGWGLHRGTINLTCYNLHTCTQSAFGGGAGVSLLWQIIFQPRHIPVPQEKSP